MLKVHFPRLLKADDLLCLQLGQLTKKLQWFKTHLELSWFLSVNGYNGKRVCHYR